MIFFFFNDTATTEIYTLSLHDALPILTLMIGAAPSTCFHISRAVSPCSAATPFAIRASRSPARSEEHMSELQSRSDLVCRLLLEKKKNELKRKHTLIDQTNERR